MNEAIASLSKTDGVLGVIVFDDGGTCLSNDLPPPYEPILLSDVLKRLIVAFDLFASLDDGAVTSFSVECESGSLVVRRVDRNWVLALTNQNVNMNMLNVAMNVVALNVGRGATSASGTRPGMRSSFDGMSGSLFSKSQTSEAGANVDIPPDAVERGVLQQILLVYKEYLGPAAKMVFKTQLAALGVTSRTLRRSQFGDLMTRLTAKIPSPQRQREFADAVQKLQQRMMVP